jgi:hypothetical protein
MTVQELIAQLRYMPMEALVKSTDSFSGFEPIIEVFQHTDGSVIIAMWPEHEASPNTERLTKSWFDTRPRMRYDTQMMQEGEHQMLYSIEATINTNRFGTEYSHVYSVSSTDIAQFMKELHELWPDATSWVLVLTKV